jgi:hypothetical protein
MMMPAPVANFQTNIQTAAPSDPVPETDLLLQQLLDESTAASDFHGFDEETSGDEEELLDPASLDSLAMYEYLAQNGTYDDMAEAPISDQGQGNQDGANGVMEDEESFMPLMPGRLQCSDCRVVRQIRVQTG